MRSTKNRFPLLKGKGSSNAQRTGAFEHLSLVCADVLALFQRAVVVFYAIFCGFDAVLSENDGDQ
ncbi:MAG: hypothetical protein RLZZ511_514 [Cyanobacteriota bacterium]